MRFETALAHLLVYDFRLKVAAGEVEDPDERALPVPAEVLAVLTRYTREPPSPVGLFGSPHEKITGNRILSEWFAAQLLDAALVRCVAACDRLATLLWTHAEIPLPRRKDAVRFPAFTRDDLRTVAPHYAERSDWPALEALTDDPLFEVAKALRNEFTHQRRLVAWTPWWSTLQAAVFSSR